jgi:hypothetical protein
VHAPQRTSLLLSPPVHNNLAFPTGTAAVGNLLASDGLTPLIVAPTSVYYSMAESEKDSVHRQRLL